MADDFEIQHLPKLCNEALILAVLAGGARHGYQLALEIEERSGGFFRFNHGTLYPILHKLEKEGLIRGRWLGDGGTRKRRQYELTSKGRRRAAELMRSWREFYSRFFDITEASET